MRLLYFGRLAEVAGTRGGEVDLPAGVATVGRARGWIGRENPALGQALASPTVRAVVDDEVATDDRSLSGATELAFLPPVSGG